MTAKNTKIINMQIKDIFLNDHFSKPTNVVNRVDFDWQKHANGIVNIAKHLQPTFRITDDNRSVLKQLLLYFTGQSEFDGSLSKGLMIIGQKGTGKTLLFDIFKRYTSEIIHTNSYKEYTMQDIVTKTAEKGLSYLDKFGRSKRPITCFIDDIAVFDEHVKNYGTDIEVGERLMAHRYIVFEKERKLTHITTNKSPAQLAELYDSRTSDRMKQMFNVIHLKGNSFRK